MADRSKMDVGVGADGAAGGGFNWVADATQSLERHDPAKAERRRGRPKGASNKKTADFAAWYAAKGFKDPLELMAEFMSADPVALQAFFAEHERTQKAIGKQFGLAVPSLSEIVEEQLSCAEKIAPYLHGKAPTRIEVTDERLPVLVVNLGDNQLDQAKRIALSRGLSVGAPLTIDTNKNNDLANEPKPSLTGQSLMDRISK